MAETGTQPGKRMWPPLHIADLLFSISNVALIVGLALTVVATIVSVWMANVREGYSKIELSEANKRIAEADARAVGANARAVEAALQLEKFKAPRTLSDEQRELVISQVRAFAGQEYTAVISPAGVDVRPLWVTLDRTLAAAGWSRVNPAGLATGNPPAGIAVDPGVGIAIVIDRKSLPGIGPAAQTLVAALNSTGIESELAFGNDPKEKRANIITILIGLKPQ
jgi:hypothetical protein